MLTFCSNRDVSYVIRRIHIVRRIEYNAYYTILNKSVRIVQHIFLLLGDFLSFQAISAPKTAFLRASNAIT
jgi:hypothetical protein